MKQKKGCVYFFKHTGLNPVKIGFSDSETPLDRFNSFKTYAPFGAECLGFIETFNANELERELHNKFSHLRLEGEWFNISVDVVKDLISNYASREQLKDMSDFNILYMNMKERKIKFKNVRNQYDLTTNEIKEIFINELKDNKLLNLVHFSKEYKISRQTLSRWKKEFKNVTLCIN